MRQPAADGQSPLTVSTQWRRQEGDVFFVAADVDLRAFLDHISFIVETGDHRRLAAAMADGADFAKLVGNGEQFPGGREKLALKIRAQAVGHHRNVQPVCNTGKLPDMVFGQEVGFIDENAGDGRFGIQGLHFGEDIGVSVEGPCVGRQADARRDPAEAGPVVKGGRENQRAHAALVIIIGCL